VSNTTTSRKVFDSYRSIRLISYLTIWLSYLIFMSNHAPRGIDWFLWHLQRIYNAVQFVKVNGYFSTYGFSIWSSCQDCGFTFSEWVDRIYVSGTVFTLFPYIFLNHLEGFEALQKYGPQIDKFAIFITAAVAAELIIICVQKHSTLPSFFLGIVSFLLFTTTPWTYKMLLSSWTEIYFLLFFLTGIFLFAIEKSKSALSMLFLASFFHYQWASATLGLYGLLLLGSHFFTRDLYSRLYFPHYARSVKGAVIFIFSMLFPVLFEAWLRLLAEGNIKNSSGSSLLFRMGISGEDIHNGGLLGALQFLGGNRLTICLGDYSSGILSSNLTEGITRYNCSLSIIGMLMVSISAIVGIIILLKKSEQAKWIVFPLFFAFLLFTTILQQSLSVHLMGYSYIFSFLFAAGIVNLMVFLAQFIGSATLKVVVSIPCVLGIVFLSIRVSMLTGLNG
jgi:hypothetical protein